MYVPYHFPSFGAGLNLKAKADAVSEEECIDALNVLFTDEGAVAQRDGYTAFTASALTNRPASLHAHYRASANPQLLAGCGTRLEALDSAGAVVASLTGLTDGTWGFARFGTPNSEVSYAGQGNTTLRSWNGSAWATVANTPAAGALAVFATSNRLVAARFNTTTGGPTGGAGTSSPSHIYFSDPGDPTTWGATNFLQLTPGDGEQIQALVAWREFVLAFKETKFFVFSGESTDAGGGAVFDYYTVDTGVGLVAPRAVCATERGVYFLARDGVYLTNGGEPARVSDRIAPIFNGGSSTYYLGGELLQTQIASCAMTYHDSRIYLSYPTATAANTRTLVYDPAFDWYSLYDIPASCLLSYKPSSTPELFFGYASGSNHVGRHSSAYTNDAGTAITSRWRSGWHDLGDGSEKTVRQRQFWGSGKVFTGASTDFAASQGGLTQLDFTDPNASSWEDGFWEIGKWSSGAGLVTQYDTRATQGTVFSLFFQNNILNQSWSLNRGELHIREVRLPGLSGRRR